MAEVAKYMIKKEWKEFSLSLDKVKTELESLAGPQFCGLQAHAHLEIWFKEEPTQEEKELVDAYWEGLTDSSAEAAGYYSQQQYQDAIQAAKLDALTKSFDQLSVAQKKLLMGLTPSAEELGLGV